MKKMKKLFNDLFCDLETSIKSVVFVLIPIATLFSVMSDRRPYNYLNIAVYGIISILILFYILKYKSFKFDVFTLLILTFNFSILISQIVNNHILQFPRTIILLSLFSILLYQFFINVKNKESVFIAILIGGLLFAGYFIIIYRKNLFNFNLDFSQRLGSDFSDQNDLCKYLAVFGIISLICVFKSKLSLKIPFAVSMALFFALILLTGSISGLLCFVITFLITIVISVKRQNRILSIAVIAGLIVLFVVLIQLPALSYFKERIEKIFASLANTGEKRDGSAADRMQLFKESFRLFMTKPLFGYGYDQVQNYTHGSGLFSHNNFTELGASFGVVGLLIYEVILLMPLVKSIKEKKTNSFLISTTIYLFIFQIFLVIFRKKIEFILLPLYFSMACYGYYSYYELKFSNKKFSLQFVKSNKKRDEAIEKSNKKLRIVNLFSLDDFSIKHSKWLSDLLGEQGEIINIGITDKEVNSNSNLKIYNFDSGINFFKFRELSFEIDDLNADIVYIDSKLLSYSYLNCTNPDSRVVCYLRDDFDNKKLYKSKSVTYVAISKSTTSRFEENNRKNKYRLVYIPLDLKKNKTRKKKKAKDRKYVSTFIGNNRFVSDYRTTVDIFNNSHSNKGDNKFAIIASSDAVKQISKYLKDNKIECIDLVESNGLNMIDTLLDSKTVFIPSFDRLAYPICEVCDSISDVVVSKEDTCYQMKFDTKAKIISGESKESVAEIFAGNNFKIRCTEDEIDESVYRYILLYEYLSVFNID